MLALRLSMWPSVLVGFSVSSHWLLDLLVHRPDLQLYPNGPKVGFALWNYPVPEQVLEIGLLAVFGAAWTASRKAQGRTAWSAVAFIAFLVVLQIVAMLAPPPAGQIGFQSALTILIIYLLVTALAALADQRSGVSAI
jgi:hypothetical protein